MPLLKERSGQRYGRLVVIERYGETSPVLWRCMCDCGNETIASGHSLGRSEKSSCGCLWKETRSNNMRSVQAKRRAQAVQKELGYIAGAAKAPWYTLPSGYRGYCFHGHPLGRKMILEHWHVWGLEHGWALARRLLNMHCSLHHKNAVRSDNRLENLELRFPGRHPKGWTVGAMVETLEMLGYTISGSE